MQYLRIKIRPTSPFITQLVSDTIFGQICYTLSLMGKDIDKMLSNYETDPFLVVSNFFPLGYASKPQMPIKTPKDINVYKLADRKKEKKQNKVLLDDVRKSGKFLLKNNKQSSEDIVGYKVTKSSVVHAYINRMTGTTDDNSCSPYTNVEHTYGAENNEEFTFDFYMYVKEEYKEQVISALEMMGKMGYGKRASIGRGNFIVEGNTDVDIDISNKNSLFTLGNCVISGLHDKAEKIYYLPQTRFGKHGIATAEDTPFKSPFVMAEQGALLYNVKEEMFNKPYIGKAITGISYINNTVSQGYSLYIPIKIEEEMFNYEQQEL